MILCGSPRLLQDGGPSENGEENGEVSPMSPFFKVQTMKKWGLGLRPHFPLKRNSEEFFLWTESFRLG